MFKRLLMVAVAALNIAMTTGCGKTSMPTAADFGAHRAPSASSASWATT